MASLSAIVPVAAALSRPAFSGLSRVSAKVSSPSYFVSSVSMTLIVRSTSPGMNDRLPSAAL